VPGGEASPRGTDASGNREISPTMLARYAILSWIELIDNGFRRLYMPRSSGWASNCGSMRSANARAGSGRPTTSILVAGVMAMLAAPALPAAAGSAGYAEDSYQSMASGAGQAGGGRPQKSITYP
jgi:hypothetical protein